MFLLNMDRTELLPVQSSVSVAGDEVELKTDKKRQLSCPEKADELFFLFTAFSLPCSWGQCCP